MYYTLAIKYVFLRIISFRFIFRLLFQLIEQRHFESKYYSFIVWYFIIHVIYSLNIYVISRKNTLVNGKTIEISRIEKNNDSTYPNINSTSEATSSYGPPTATGLHDSHASNAWAIIRIMHVWLKTIPWININYTIIRNSCCIKISKCKTDKTTWHQNIFPLL